MVDHLSTICGSWDLGSTVKGPSRTRRCSRRSLKKNICFSANIYVSKNICFLKNYIYFLKKCICFWKSIYIFIKVYIFLKKHIYFSLRDLLVHRSSFYFFEKILSHSGPWVWNLPLWWFSGKNIKWPLLGIYISWFWYLTLATWLICLYTVGAFLNQIWFFFD